jgi:hypothetical protein
MELNPTEPSRLHDRIEIPDDIVRVDRLASAGAKV